MELISREEAKRKITEELDSIDHVPNWVFRRLEGVINSIPAAEEQKEGHWCYEHGYRSHCYTTGFYICSVCHNRVTRREGDKPTNFCPHCGAKMKGE
jgi:rubrerythrin